MRKVIPTRICPICSGEFEANTRGRPRRFCSPECTTKAKNTNFQRYERFDRPKSKGGRGNKILRPCGCPTRQHKPDCVLSRAFHVYENSNAHHDAISASNASKIAKANRRLEAQRLRAANKRAAAIKKAGMIPVDSISKNLPIYIACVKCKGRGPIRDFTAWKQADRTGVCKNC